MFNAIEKTSSVLAKIEQQLLKILMAALTLVVTIQITARNIGQFVNWAEDAALLIFTWAVFIGAALGVRSGTHYVIDIFGTHWRKLQVILTLLSSFGIGFFLVVVIWQGTLMVFAVKGRISGAGGIDMSLYFVSLPLAAVFSLLHLIESVVTEIKSLRKGLR